MHGKYPCTKIVEKLAWDKKMGIAKDLTDGIPELQLHLVEYLSSIDNSKGAAQLIVDFGLDSEKFPELN